MPSYRIRTASLTLTIQALTLSLACMVSRHGHAKSLFYHLNKYTNGKDNKTHPRRSPPTVAIKASFVGAEKGAGNY